MSQHNLSFDLSQIKTQISDLEKRITKQLGKLELSTDVGKQTFLREFLFLQSALFRLKEIFDQLKKRASLVTVNQIEWDENSAHEELINVNNLIVQFREKYGLDTRK